MKLSSQRDTPRDGTYKREAQPRATMCFCGFAANAKRQSAKTSPHLVQVGLLLDAVLLQLVKACLVLGRVESCLVEAGLVLGGVGGSLKIASKSVRGMCMVGSVVRWDWCWRTHP